MNSKTLAALAGLCVAAPAMAQITSIRNDLATNFVNIANNGTATRLSSSTATQDDCSYSVVGVTNAGIGNSTYRICSNGFVQFGAVGNTTYSNTGLPPNTGGTTTNTPTAATNGQAIMPFWDDQITGAVATASNGVWAQTGDATATFGGITVGGVGVTGQVTIVQFSGMDLFGIANPQNINYELMVFANPVVSGGTTVYAVAVYQNSVFQPTVGGVGEDHNNGNNATVGYYAGNSGLGTTVQWGAGNPSGLGTAFAHYGNFVPTGTALAFVPTPGAAALLGLGALAAGRRRRA